MHEKSREILELTKDIYTPAEARQYLRVGKNTIYELLISGQLKSFKVRSQYRITRQGLLDFMEGGTQ